MIKIITKSRFIFLFFNVSSSIDTGATVVIWFLLEELIGAELNSIVLIVVICVHFQEDLFESCH